MRSALLDVKGVKSAKVTLEDGRAVVTFDPRVTSAEALINVVNQTPGPMSSIQYRAAVKP